MPQTGPIGGQAVYVPTEALRAARALGWRSGTVRETAFAWAFYSLAGALVCRVPKDDLSDDEGGPPVRLDEVPADVIATAYSSGWREGRVEATSWGWIFRSEDAAPVIVSGRPRGGPSSLEEAIETAWSQGFRLEETEHGWYFYPPGSGDACCGIARSQAGNNRVLQNLMASLRQAGLCVAAPPHGPPDISRAAP